MKVPACFGMVAEVDTTDECYTCNATIKCAEISKPRSLKGIERGLEVNLI